jgi:tRNA modification GTPase
MDYTIAAISTPIGEGGIAIIRISGPSALFVADAIFRCRQGQPSKFSTHTVHLGTVSRNGASIDQVLLTVMRGPRTYTGEDTIEINCHGGPLVARRVLRLCLESGARVAQPGEFTKRAFLNGKMDLAQAEAVMDLISAKTDLAQDAAMRIVEGHLTARINEIRDRLLSVLAQIEASLDFPEEGLPAHTEEALVSELQAILGGINNLLTTAGDGRILRHGVSVAIVGRPNVGKSSLLNRLVGRDRAIVTPIPGTTRDTLEEPVNIRGLPVTLIDTAGLRRTTDKTEQISVGRTHKALAVSDLVIHLIDSSRPFSKEDTKIATSYKHKHHVLVLNKVDLPQRIRVPVAFASENPVAVSALTGEGLPALSEAIASAIWSGIPRRCDGEVFVNERHAEALRIASYSLTYGIESLRQQLGHEVVAQQVRASLNAVGEVTGMVTTDDLLDRIFSNFCIGK